MKAALAPIDGGAVRLRLLTAADLPMTLAWRNRDEVRRWFKFNEVLPPLQHRQWFDRYAEEDGNYVWIVEQSANGEPVGQVSLYRLDRRKGEAEVGRFIAAPGCEGRGYMKAAILALKRWAFEALSLTRLHLEVFADNLRAIALYERCGFTTVRGDAQFLTMECRTVESASGATA